MQAGRYFSGYKYMKIWKNIPRYIGKYFLVYFFLVFLFFRISWIIVKMWRVLTFLQQYCSNVISKMCLFQFLLLGGNRPAPGDILQMLMTAMHEIIMIVTMKITVMHEIIMKYYNCHVNDCHACYHHDGNDITVEIMVMTITMPMVHSQVTSTPNSSDLNSSENTHEFVSRSAINFI